MESGGSANELEEKTIEQLREEAARMQLETGGCRDTLIDRLLKHLDRRREQPPKSGGRERPATDSEWVFSSPVTVAGASRERTEAGSLQQQQIISMMRQQLELSRLMAQNLARMNASTDRSEPTGRKPKGRYTDESGATVWRKPP